MQEWECIDIMLNVRQTVCFQLFGVARVYSPPLRGHCCLDQRPSQKVHFLFIWGAGEHGVRWCLLCLLGYRCATSVHMILNVIITIITARVRLFGVHDLIELVCDAECAAFILSSLHLINQISDD